MHNVLYYSIVHKYITSTMTNKNKIDSENNVTLNVRMPASIRDQFTVFCEGTDTSASRLVRMLIRAELAKFVVAHKAG